MLNGLKNSIDIIKATFMIFYFYPKLIIPLMITWCLYAPSILWLKYSFDWSALDQFELYGFAFIILFFFSFIISFSNLVLLEMIEQIEKGEKPQILKSFLHALFYNTLKALPIMLIWSLIWFILTVIEALLSKKKTNTEDEEFSAENAARTLTGIDGAKGILGYSFSLLNKGIRMLIFVIFPSIAWENASTVNSIKRGLTIVKNHASTFFFGFAITEALTILIYIPVGLLLVTVDKLSLDLPNWSWLCIFVYISFVWSYSLFIEQMFAAELYLWNIKWERACDDAVKNGLTPPKLNEIKAPVLIDGVSELLNLKK